MLMPEHESSKPKVTVEFVAPDGSTGQRSRMEDFRTVRSRIFSRLREELGDQEANRLLVPAINSYNSADFQKALRYFSEAVERYPQLADELRPHMIICKRVISIPLSASDRDHLAAVGRWKSANFLKRAFAMEPEPKLRCKWCGHFTRYIDPNDGFAYRGTNNCQVCERGYPASDFAWDGVDGQAYIYYRHSVLEKEFYAEFEAQYDVSPDHRHFMKD